MPERKDNLKNTQNVAASIRPVGYEKFSVVKPNTVKPNKDKDRPVPPKPKKKGK